MQESNTHTQILRVAELKPETIHKQLGSLFEMKDIEITLQPSQDAVDIHLTSQLKDKREAKQMLDTVEQKIRARLADYIFGTGDTTLQQIIGKLLDEQKLTVATIESLTGGLIASALTDAHESSAHFLGGVVAYSTLLKERMGVPHETMERYGVISNETAIAMAKAVKKALDIEIGLGITGVAGPDKQEDQPVGTVHIAVAGPYGILSCMGSEKCAGLDREENKQAATISALNLLRRYLEKRGDKQEQNEDPTLIDSKITQSTS
ncbi:nicotinamide-nucleotide amidohydrolase family protein [Dictyobacter arantiisoli]|uniref:CinA-like protein n=1 Tax=Dictyobacter arantiisoli TaxID=2014874 RepID=A0A5A5T737_9CHLR|nr:nicotinamide-nucleotide amidohydrolase family protein [Dictyobacter arantiisoli]GCF07006.1 hypothetical protein KDI_05700 [Dictyobacter arantiisoli]